MAVKNIMIVGVGGQGIEVADEVEDFGGDEPVLGLLLTGDPQADHNAGSHGFADGLGHLGEEPAAILRAAAVFVGAGVHGRVEELDGQVAVAGDDLHAVYSGVGDALRSSPISGDDVLDLVGGQRFGHDLEPLLRFVARGFGAGCHSALAVHDFAAGVEELGEDRGAMTVDRLGDGLISGDGGFVSGHEDVAGVAGSLVDAGDLEDDKSGPALRASFVIGDEVVADVAVIVEDGVVAGRDDAVADRCRAEGDGFEEVREQL